MDKEMQQFQDDLMESVRDMKAGRAARTHHVPLAPAADARAHAGLSQSQFAALPGVSVRTLQGWEFVGRNNQRALRPMWVPHPVQCATLIAPTRAKYGGCHEG